VSAVTAPAIGGTVSTVRDYLSLLKLRIVLLLDATAVGVMFPAAHGHPRVVAVFAVLVGGTFAAGGAHAINSWFDRDIDAAMHRTRRRPLPGGRIPAWHALAIGVALNILAFAVLWSGANLLAASLADGGGHLRHSQYVARHRSDVPAGALRRARPVLGAQRDQHGGESVVLGRGQPHECGPVEGRGPRSGSGVCNTGGWGHGFLLLDPGSPR